MSEKPYSTTKDVQRVARDLQRLAEALGAMEFPATAPTTAADVSRARAVAAEFASDAQATEGLTLAEAGRIRRAYKMAEAATPRLIIDADAAGMNGAEIARELDVSGSYVSRILREHKAGK